jgi:hypothetical protein
VTLDVEEKNMLKGTIFCRLSRLKWVFALGSGMFFHALLSATVAHARWAPTMYEVWRLKLREVIALDGGDPGVYGVPWSKWDERGAVQAYGRELILLQAPPTWEAIIAKPLEE